jgi:predicted transcriptional regulator
MVHATAAPLILDLLEWVAKGERTYEEVMEAWRTSCPRLSVWEEVNDRGLIVREQVNGRCVVKITTAGLSLLERRKSLENSKKRRGKPT